MKKIKRNKSIIQRNRTTYDDTGIVSIGSKTFIYLDKTIGISTKATFILGESIVEYKNKKS